MSAGLKIRPCTVVFCGRAVNCLVGHVAVEHATAEGDFKLVIKQLLFKSKRKRIT